MQYLSDAWLHEADTALSQISPLDATVVVGYLVQGGQDGDRSYSLRLGPDRVGIDLGLDDAGVTLKMNWPIACGIAQGTTSAQRAFLDGLLVLDGDVGLLLGNPDALGAVDDQLRQLRSVTEY